MKTIYKYINAFKPSVAENSGIVVRVGIIAKINKSENKMSNKIKKTFIPITTLMVTCLFLLGNVDLFAKPVSISGWCETCDPPIKGTYVFHYEGGEPYTTFYPDDDSDPQKKKGHKTWVVNPNGGNGGLGNVLSGLLAETGFSFSVTHNDLIISTDKPIEIAIVDITTYTFVTAMISVSGTLSIDISSLPVGCKYNVLVFQEIQRYGFQAIKNHLFCKEVN